MRVTSLPIPPNLLEVLKVMHAECGVNGVQTIRGGTQINLSGCTFKAVAKLLRAIGWQIDAYFQKPWKFSGVWSSKMEKDGFHIMHNHPEGSVSGCYYVSVGEGAELVVGNKVITPEPGMLVLFNSQTPHQTTPYKGDESRVTVAFDVVPA